MDIATDHTDPFFCAYFHEFLHSAMFILDKIYKILSSTKKLVFKIEINTRKKPDGVWTGIDIPLKYHNMGD